MSDLTNEAAKGAIENGARRLEQLLGDIERSAREAVVVVEQAKAQVGVLAGSDGLFDREPAIVFSGFASDAHFRDDMPIEGAEVRLWPLNHQINLRRVTGDGKLPTGDYAVVVAMIPVATRKARP